MKRECTGCHQLKPLDEFGAQKSGKHGRRARCLACMAAADRDRRDARRGGPARAPREPSENGMVRCTQCRTVRPADQFRAEPRNRDGLRSACRACDVAASAAYNARARADGTLWNLRFPQEAHRLRRRAHLRRYGIAPEDYDAMLAAQGGGCAICGADNPRARNRRYFTVDHDHTTGAVRGLLCTPCNTGIGALADDPDRIAAALAYVRGGAIT